jgi:regulator of protease activity HflC (stomatin/prohibitin superfamily)
MLLSSSSPPVRRDLLVTIPHNEITATSLVPPPMSTIMLPVGSDTGICAPIAAAMDSSIKPTLRAGTPAEIVASSIARFSTSVTPEGTQITTCGLREKKLPERAFLIKYLSMERVVSKSAITPSLSGRMATIEPGVLPIICLASSPTAITLFVCVLIATTEGSFKIIPLPRSKTSVLAVPRSIPKWCVNINIFFPALVFSKYYLYYHIKNGVFQIYLLTARKIHCNMILISNKNQGGIKMKTNVYEEIQLNPFSGMAMLILNTLFLLFFTAVFVFGIFLASDAHSSTALGVVLIIVGAILGFVVCPIMYAGLKIIKPNEALVLTLFGKYTGTIKKEGFFFVNPLSTAVNPAESSTTQSQTTTPATTVASELGINLNLSGFSGGSKKISLKSSTLSNDKQKINDQLGNPIIIGIVVVWRVVNTARAVFNVYNYKEFLSIQCDSALRNIVRLYPYDSYGSDNEKSLHGSSQEIAVKLKDEIQSKVEIAGLQIVEARITNLYYAPEIAAAMLQRQQASAVVDAKQLIVEAAVGMVSLALDKLAEDDVVHLDEERKAAMASNLLVVLCGNKDAQPVVNSGSIY